MQSYIRKGDQKNRNLRDQDIVLYCNYVYKCVSASQRRKCFFFIMGLKNRRFSLDSAVLDGGLGVRRGSRFPSKKSKQSQSLDDAQQEIQELHQNLNSSMSLSLCVLREQTITEENPERSDGSITRHSFSKRNISFHKLFPEIPEEENLTHTFTCALQKEVLYHGKLFVSENHVCFHSSVLLKDTKVVIPLSSVREVKKHNSALSVLSIHSADGEKYSFVSLRNREMCCKLLHSICLLAQEESANSSPHLSSADNEADQEVASSFSSLEDCGDHDFSSIDNDSSFPQMSSEGPSRSNSTRHSSLIDEDYKDVSWIWGVTDRVTPFFFLKQSRDLSFYFCVFILLLVLLLLASGYIGLRIIALEEQLNSLGALNDLSSYHREYQEN
ncbi:GRAM domain-containing protein 2B-like isoform X2 [Acanthochromis polyacanthus]|uniref:GRAM domain-containing protein 2B-like isoform X2 n=1 Tax=Acanthochromis polyacanthus TaxID=80966 RepID=UPI0022341490|nr:GRAM domain-containing protein 2B-like isoform X2 [Acanthochromis polyacanthus]